MVFLEEKNLGLSRVNRLQKMGGQHQQEAINITIFCSAVANHELLHLEKPKLFNGSIKQHCSHYYF